MKSLLLVLILFVVFVSLLSSYTIVENYKNLNIDKKIIINLLDTNEGKRRWNIIKDHPFFKDNSMRFIGVNGNKADLSQFFKKKYVVPKWDMGKWKNEESKIISMSNGEIGCIMSHLNVWKRLIDSNYFNKIMILEDDAIDISKDIKQRMNDIWNNVPDDWDIILVGFWLHKGNNTMKVNKYINKVKDFVLLHSYIINKKGARKLLRLLPVDAPLDTWISMHSNKLNIYCHSFFKNKNALRPSSRLIRQKRVAKQIVNTNNW